MPPPPELASFPPRWEFLRLGTMDIDKEKSECSSRIVLISHQNQHQREIQLLEWERNRKIIGILGGGLSQLETLDPLLWWWCYPVLVIHITYHHDYQHWYHWSSHFTAVRTARITVYMPCWHFQRFVLVIGWAMSAWYYGCYLLTTRSPPGRRTCGSGDCPALPVGAFWIIVCQPPCLLRLNHFFAL